MPYLKTSGIKRNKSRGVALWKSAGKAAGRAIKKRYGTSGGLKRAIRDIALVKQMVNAEKKVIESTYATTSGIGQCNANSDSGYWGLDITPKPAEGSTRSGRNGASIKLCSMIMRGQLQQQANLNTDFRFRVYVIKTVGQSATVDTTLCNRFLLADPVSTCTDFNSSRNPDHFRNFIVLAKRTYKIANDSASTQNQFKDFQINLKFKHHHIRFDGDSATQVNMGQIWLMVVADTGNINSSTASTLTNVANKAVSTGANAFFYVRSYYYDN